MMSAAVEKKMKNPELRSENPDPVDIHVGSRLRMRRNLIGLSQEQLGKSLGLTFQQIQKYERGINRIGASRLFHIANTLSVQVGYFYEGLPASIRLALQPGFAENGQEPLGKAAGPEQQGDDDILRRRETLELIRAYYRIQDIKQRRKVYELIRSMSNEE